MVRKFALVLVGAVTLAAGVLLAAVPASSGVGQIASIGCSQWGPVLGQSNLAGWETTHDDFTETEGQGGATLSVWASAGSAVWDTVDDHTDGDEVAVVWMLCIVDNANHPDADIISVYDSIRSRWPVQPIYVVPLNVETSVCSRSGYDESVLRQQWILDNLSGTLSGPILTPPFQAEETTDGCHPNQDGVDRYTELFAEWVPVMLAGGTISSGSFWDDDGSVHEGFIEAIAAEGITLGCATNLYCPYDPITRAQMASFLDRAFDPGATTTDYFGDDAGNTHEAAINRIAAAGITLGCDSADPTLFCPDAVVSRAQMASFIDRAIELDATTTDFFSDDDGITHEAAINRIANDGITVGCFGGDPTLFCPWDPVTRAQMASFLGRALDLEEIWP